MISSNLHPSSQVLCSPSLLWYLERLWWSSAEHTPKGCIFEMGGPTLCHP